MCGGIVRRRNAVRTLGNHLPVFHYDSRERAPIPGADVLNRQLDGAGHEGIAHIDQLPTPDSRFAYTYTDLPDWVIKIVPQDTPIAVSKVKQQYGSSLMRLWGDQRRLQGRQSAVNSPGFQRGNA
jgi:hypothetical protein